MEVTTDQPAPNARCAAGRRGFTFLEVLFAVIILGVGFIMLAGMFPVAIQQQRASIDDSQAPAIGGGAVATISATFRSADYPPNPPGPPPKMLSDLLVATGNAQNPNITTNPVKVYSFRDARIGSNKDRVWGLIAGNLVLASDPSLAYVPFYMRDTDDSKTVTKLASSARILVVPVRVRSQNRYDTVTDTDTTGGMANLEPNLVTVTVNGKTVPNTITFKDKSPTTTNGSSGAVAPGAYVIISSDPKKGLSNGFFFQVGANISGSGNGSTWELVPGKDLNAFSTAVTTITSADAFVVGKAPTAKVRTGATFSGVPQDIGVYTGIISLPSQ